MENYVWYACYGSNLNYDRFICYIEGGTPKGSNKKDRGCRVNKKPPEKTDVITIPYTLYFARHSSKWDGSGVAFIGLAKDEKKRTLGKLYLITEDQFVDLFVQENGEKYESMLKKDKLSVNLEDIKKQNSKVIWESPWYGNIIYLGTGRDEIPIFTTTSSREERPYSRPNENYLYHVITGLKKPPYYLSNDEIVQYLYDKKGIQEGGYKENDLVNIVARCN